MRGRLPLLVRASFGDSNGNDHHSSLEPAPLLARFDRLDNAYAREVRLGCYEILRDVGEPLDQHDGSAFERADKKCATVIRASVEQANSLRLPQREPFQVGLREYASVVDLNQVAPPENPD